MKKWILTVIIFLLMIAIGVGVAFVITSDFTSQTDTAGGNWEGETVNSLRPLIQNGLIPKDVNIVEFLDYNNDGQSDYQVRSEYCNGVYAFEAASADESLAYYGDTITSYLCYQNKDENGNDQYCFLKSNVNILNQYTKEIGVVFGPNSQFSGTDLSFVNNIMQMEISAEDDNNISYKTSDGVCNYNIIVSKETGFVRNIVYGNNEYTYYVTITPIENISIGKYDVKYADEGPGLFVETLFYGLRELYD